jgi:hypothetical protein
MPGATILFLEDNTDGRDFFMQRFWGFWAVVEDCGGEEKVADFKYSVGWFGGSWLERGRRHVAVGPRFWRASLCGGW